MSHSFATHWTVAHQAPVSKGFFWQEYWSELPFPSPGNFPDPEIEPRSPALQADPCWTTREEGEERGSDCKESTSNVGDLGSIPGSGRCHGGGHGNPLQYSCLENSMDKETWRATVHRVTKSQAWMSDFHFY